MRFIVTGLWAEAFPSHRDDPFIGQEEACILNATHLPRSEDSEFEATADDVKTEADEPVQQACEEEQAWMGEFMCFVERL